MVKRQQVVSRRRLLRDAAFLILGSGGAVLVAACAPAAAPTPEPKVVEKKVEVERVVTQVVERVVTPTPVAEAKPTPKAPVTLLWLMRPGSGTAYQSDLLIAEWNANNANKVKMELPPQGDWRPKAYAAIQAGQMQWDCFGLMEAAWKKVEWIESGLIIPIEDYIRSSSQKGAKELIEGIVPTVRREITYKGKIIGIPGNNGSIALQWFWEPLRAVGFEKQPATWEETEEAATKIKEKYGKAMTPFAVTDTALSGLAPLVYSATDRPYTDDGIIDVTGDAAMRSIAWLQGLVKKDLIAPHGSDDHYNMWQRKTLAMILGYDALGAWAQKQRGITEADTGITIYPKDGGKNAGTPFWTNCIVLFKGGPHPQEMTDHLVWYFGPYNTLAMKALTETAPKPVYEYTYEKIVKPNKDYAWMLKGMEVVRNSLPFPDNTYFDMWRTMTREAMSPLLERNPKVGAQEAMQKLLKDVRDEIAKQKVKS